MGRFFQLRPPADTKDEILARRRFFLPGIVCERCGPWAVTGLSFPEIELPASLDKSLYTTPRAVPVETFQKLAEPIRGLLPRGVEPSPGLQFGQLRGAIVRRGASDFVWLNPWTLLAREIVAEVLAREFLVSAVEVAFALPPASPDPKLVELCIHPAAEAVLVPLESPCARCGRRGFTTEGELRSIDCAGELPSIFRLANVPTQVIGSEAFVDLLQERRWTGIELREVARL
jgi:hypothetical protein